MIALYKRFGLPPLKLTVCQDRKQLVVHRDIACSTTSSEVCNSTCEELGDDQPGDAGDENRLPDASLENYPIISLYSR